MYSRKKIIFMLVCCLLSICMSTQLSCMLLAHAEGESVATSSEATVIPADTSSEVIIQHDGDATTITIVSGDSTISDATTTASDATSDAVATEDMSSDMVGDIASDMTSDIVSAIASAESGNIIVAHTSDETSDPTSVSTSEVNATTEVLLDDIATPAEVTVATPSEAIEGTDHKILLAQADVQSTYTLSVPAMTQIDFTANDTLLEVTVSGTSDTRIEVTATSTNSWRLTSTSGATIGYGLYTNTTDTTAITAWTLEPLSADTKISVHAIADVVDLFFADSGDYTDSIRFVASSVQ